MYHIIGKCTAIHVVKHDRPQNENGNKRIRQAWSGTLCFVLGWHGMRNGLEHDYGMERTKPALLWDSLMYNTRSITLLVFSTIFV